MASPNPRTKKGSEKASRNRQENMTSMERSNYDALRSKGFGDSESASMATNPAGRLMPRYNTPESKKIRGEK